MEGAVVSGGIEAVAAVIMVTENVTDGAYGVDDFRVTEIDPSGRRILIVPFDPGFTRSEEIAMNDDLAVDREAPGSGRAVAFLRDYSDAEARAQDDGKPLLVDFETTWCGPCKLMDEWVCTASAVVDASEGLVAVKVDGEERLDLKESFRVEGFPTVILLDPEGVELRRVSGRVNVAEMTELLSPSG